MVNPDGADRRAHLDLPRRVLAKPSFRPHTLIKVKETLLPSSAVKYGVPFAPAGAIQPASGGEWTSECAHGVGERVRSSSGPNRYRASFDGVSNVGSADIRGRRSHLTILPHPLSP